MARCEERDRQRSVRDLLRAARNKPVVIETRGTPSYVLLPLNDRVLDFLLETNRRLIADCARIRKEMRNGKRYSLDEVERILGRGASVRKGKRTTVRRSRNARGA